MLLRKQGWGKETQIFFSSYLQLNINHILLRQAEIRKYYTSTHKATHACVNRCAELLSKASHLLLWLLHWEFSSKQGKKMQEPISLSTPDIRSQYNRNVRDVSRKTAAY